MGEDSVAVVSCDVGETGAVVVTTGSVVVAVVTVVFGACVAVAVVIVVVGFVVVLTEVTDVVELEVGTFTDMSGFWSWLSKLVFWLVVFPVAPYSSFMLLTLHSTQIVYDPAG